MWLPKINNEEYAAFASVDLPALERITKCLKRLKEQIGENLDEATDATLTEQYKGTRKTLGDLVKVFSEARNIIEKQQRRQ